MKKLFLSTILLLNVALLSAQTADDASAFNSKFIRDYYRLQLQMVKATPGFTPPVASRAFGYSGLALYESVVNGMPTMRSLSGSAYEFELPTTLLEAEDLHWGTVANNAIATILDSIYSNASATHKDELHALRDLYNTAFSATVPSSVFNASVTHGQQVANAVFDYSRIDGGFNCQHNNFPTDYVPPVGEGLWVPVGNQTCLQPYWGSNRPFVQADTIESVMPPAPPAYDADPASEFYLQAYIVYHAVNNATPEETDIANYWADGGGTITPPGHSISMLTNILDNEDADLATAVKSYAQLGMALSDAFLTCWRTKYRDNLLRPITYIQEHIDPNWNVIVSTPPFPEYVSGHSSQSGAFYGVMTDLFGEFYTFIDSTHGQDFGGPREFHSFLEAAQEAAISRLYGGIHYEFGNNEGLYLGMRVAHNVNELFRAAQVNVGIADAEAVEINVYPNPATDMVTISGIRGNVDVTITDLNGKQLLKESRPRFSVSGLAQGVYLIRVKVDGNIWSTSRLLKL